MPGDTYNEMFYSEIAWSNKFDYLVAYIRCNIYKMLST